MLATPSATRSARADDVGTPVGINIAVGAVAVLAASTAAALVPVAGMGWRFAVVAVAVGLFAVLTVDPPALAAVVAEAWLLVNGFLVNRLGELSWHGSSDLFRLLLLAIVGGTGLTVGRIGRQAAQWRARWRMGVLVQAMVTEFDEEERPRA